MSIKNEIQNDSWSTFRDKTFLEKQKELLPQFDRYFDQDSCVLFDGFLLSSLEYINSSSTENINPMVKIELRFGDISVTIVFLYVTDVEVKTVETIDDDYCCFREEIQNSAICYENGEIEFAAEFTSKLRIYVKCCGIRVINND